MKTRKFKLIKAFPLSPSLNTIVEFKSEKDLNDGIYEVGAITCLMLTDCTSYPEFWRDVSNGDIEEEVDKIFEDSTYELSYSNTDWDTELDISLCKKKIVQYIKELLNEKVSDI